MVLGNRVLSADLVELGDVEALRATLRRTVGYLSLGIEYRLRTAATAPAEGANEGPSASHAAPICRQPDRSTWHGRRRCCEISLLHLFRIGYGLTVQLRKLAVVLVGSSEGC